MSLLRTLYFPELDQAKMLDALLDWHAETASTGALALLPEAEKDQVPLLQAMYRANGLSLVGALFPAIIDGEQFRSHGALLLPFTEMPDSALLPNLPADANAAAARIANAVEPLLTDAGNTLFLIFDAMLPNIASILDALYLLLADRVVYAGVNAGSETFQPMSCLFDDHSLVADGVLCLLLPGKQGAAIDHGYLAPKEIITATSTVGNRIVSIDWRPAFEVYREQVHDLYQIDLTVDNFYQYATHFPFGIVLANNELVVRIPVALADDGSLFCIGEVPANAMLTLLYAPQVDSVRSVSRIRQILHNDFGPLGPRELLVFYCAGRRLHLGDDALKELHSLGSTLNAANVVGALSLGEIGSLSNWGYPLFHNATLVCRPWGEHGT
ncbi:MAG TPA: FIST N-terminal domain-containing protein [Accumulibacter sp.]|nr:FIST N-terminal domain-containing protein [Accumulibacter sp.]HMW17568.1 FIST N-terminal domain-containing protein [Accumulibacter sp.]HNC17024.1 FIST N-terminal domain-containing protein [Accumulibacter sp.]HND79674.1 FIST N-terminal domain-containing protein [Accumulibacter sp.]HNE12743.1 FIST N-terminal domain-containing protein [Accumulibacter sp.]